LQIEHILDFVMVIAFLVLVLALDDIRFNIWQKI